MFNQWWAFVKKKKKTAAEPETLNIILLVTIIRIIRIKNIVKFDFDVVCLMEKTGMYLFFVFL